jgi:hypothetical protein
MEARTGVYSAKQRVASAKRLTTAAFDTERTTVRLIVILATVPYLALLEIFTVSRVHFPDFQLANKACAKAATSAIY